MKKFIYRPFILIFVLFLFLISILQFSYGYFDSLFVSKTSTINVGNWLTYNPEPNDVIDYIKNTKFPEDEDFADYILDTLGNYENGEYVLDETYENYTMNEIIEIVDLIDDFTNNFLDSDNGDPVFPNIAVEPVQMNNINSFAPGDVQYIKQVIHTADLQTDPYWTPVTFQLLLSSPEGFDLSDFSVEILFDLSPLSVQTPFQYTFRLNDIARDYWKTIVKQEIPSNLTSNLPSFDSINYTNRAFNTLQNKYLLFKHEYSKPNMQGEWRRFPQGPNLFYESPKLGGGNNSWSGIKQQFFEESVPEKVAGMTLSGRHDGGLVDLMFHLAGRKPRSGSSLPVIPVVIVISRGKEVDSNNNVLPNQKTDIITPEVKLRVVKQSIFDL